ncbi:MAG: M60 family metallopeptidase, partial [Oscillospiraceae bacterium]|nr:M60 family metallopeptidase [Oscillospiraceae bacterium]
ISTPVVLLSLAAIPVKNALGSGSREEKIGVLYNDILAWEDIMAICKQTQGIDKVYGDNDMLSRQNVRCMTMFAGAFMYAAGNHIGIGYGSCGGTVTGRPIAMLGENAGSNQLFGWGIAHEIGHNMDKLGKAEITNNIYSIMVQTWDGKENTLPSRLEKSGKYRGIFTKVAQGYPGASNDVFVQLGMYWQLHLAYAGGEAPLEFYNSFFKAWKAGTYTAGASGYNDRVALTAAGVAQKDLTEFFTRWGMVLSDKAKATLATYEPESRAIWYLNDQSRRDRLAGVTEATGTVTATAVLTEGKDNEITVTIDASGVEGKLQGFEIRRDGKSVAFVQANGNTSVTYTDVIGSGNHRVYVYEVVAYDTLGNQVGERANAGEVRVAYDKTVDPADYTITMQEGTAVISLKRELQVSGLKLGSLPLEGGRYTVSVTDGEGVTTTALTGTFDEASNQAVDDKESFVSYFKMPGAAETDTRIWTYDAVTVTVTGIPAGVQPEDVQLITYPGDDVAFLEGGTMGLLSADYHYTALDENGNETHEVIPECTLVILGTYR